MRSRRRGPRASAASRRRAFRPAWILLLASLAGPGAAAQEIRGRVTDAENGAPVGLAAVILLDAERRPRASGAAGVDGRYRIAAPGPGEYYLVVERLGYFGNETPLLALESEGVYGVDVEMRPEPFRLDPLRVTVENERLERFLTLSFGQHPATLPGYRAIQGLRLEEAKLKAKDNTDLLRWLYIPVSHGRRVCVGTFGAPLPPRTWAERTNAEAEPAAPGRQCGSLYVDGYRCRNELIEEIDMDRIAVIVTVEGAVHMYTRDFDWTFRRAGGAPGC